MHLQLSKKLICEDTINDGNGYTSVEIDESEIIGNINTVPGCLELLIEIQKKPEYFVF